MSYPMKKTTTSDRRTLFIAVIAGLVVVGLSLVCYGQFAATGTGAGSFVDTAIYLGWCTLGAAFGGLALWGFTKHLS